jgi:catechol 2,3-dioxygenase-like lactoylglutathione lyase family enzyme
VSDAPDLGSLLEVLDRHGVAFVVAGSVGALAHGAGGVEPADLDIVPATDEANLRRLSEALSELDAVAATETGAWETDADGEHRWVEDGIGRSTRPLDATDADTFDHSFTTRLGRLDVVPRIAGRYALLRERATRAAIAGRQAWVAHPIDLLTGMTAPRRTKDGPRVRHLRAMATAPTSASGVGFIGFRTDRFEELVALFRDRIGLAIVREAPGATWFRLGTDAELHVYAATDPDHAFFTTGPVVGLRVDDVDATRAALQADGLEMVTEIERTDDAAWCHFRAPDGTVVEIIGPRPTGH